jgi:hypothetical protein
MAPAKKRTMPASISGPASKWTTFSTVLRVSEQWGRKNSVSHAVAAHRWKRFSTGP